MRVINVLVLIVLISSCKGKQETSELDPKQMRNEVPPTEVKTVPAQRVQFEYLIHATGKIQAETEIEIQSQTGGIVEKVWVSNGAQVTRGQTMVTLVNTRQTLARDKARLQLQEREIDYQDALLAYNVVDSNRLKLAKNNIRISSGLAAAEIGFKEAQFALEQTIIKAPITGTASNLEVNVGSLLSANQTVCLIHSTRQLTVITELLESDALLLRPGMEAEVKTLSSGQVVIASVKEVNPRVDKKTSLVKVTLEILSASLLLPGMTAQVTLKVPNEKVIVVPREAVIVRNGRQVVFTVENGLAKWHYVNVGRDNGNEVEILEGLNEGQQVIITNNLQLAHDALVKSI